jgi:very-short-patch-repair endonuclease
MYNINFNPQKRFDDCRDKYTLPFDFYLPDYNLIIEIMGEQHERPVNYFGGEEAFKKCIKHEKMKRDYLKANNINILDIWYYDFDKMEELILNKIQEILNK